MVVVTHPLRGRRCSSFGGRRRLPWQSKRRQSKVVRRSHSSTYTLLQTRNALAVKLRARQKPVALKTFTWNANYGTSASIDTRPHIEARMASRAGTERLATNASYGSMHHMQLVVRVGSHGALGPKTSRDITRQHISDGVPSERGPKEQHPLHLMCPCVSAAAGTAALLAMLGSNARPGGPKLVP